jgi:broad specificity phosphatase PhoE
MKIYILRHEDRTQDCSFFAPLTKDGLENAVKLIEYLEKEKIDMIFSSPFIRTLQTIYPYVKEKGLKINIEYGLSEFHHPDIIPPKAVGISLPEYIAESFQYEPTYKTIIQATELKGKEDDKDINKRIKKILRQTIEMYSNTDHNIVLVTHQSLCSAVLRIIKKNNKNYSEELTEEVINNYPTGQLTKIFDDGWKYKPIN